MSCESRDDIDKYLHHSLYLSCNINGVLHPWHVSAEVLVVLIICRVMGLITSSAPNSNFGQENHILRRVKTIMIWWHRSSKLQLQKFPWTFLNRLLSSIKNQNQTGPITETVKWVDFLPCKYQIKGLEVSARVSPTKPLITCAESTQ